MASNSHGVVTTITVSAAQLDNLNAELGGIPGAVNKAIIGAINKTLPKVRTDTVNALRDRLTASRSNIFQRTSIVKATSATSSGFVRILARRIGLINFKHRSLRGRGIEVTILQGGGAEQFRHAFIARGASNNQHIFQRKFIGGKPTPRMPIESLKSISLMRFFNTQPGMAEAATKRAGDDFNEALLSQIDRILQHRRAQRPE